MDRAVLPANPGNRIGLLGGTFDPVHKGHIALAEGVVRKLQLDSLLFVPAVLNPLKREQDATPFDHRVAMLDLAVTKWPDFFVSTIEGRRRPPSFTIDTVREFKEILGPTPELFLIVGSDAFAEIDKWKEGSSILKHASLVVVPRPPVGLKELSHTIQEMFPSFSFDTSQAAWVGPDVQGHIFFHELPPIELSSTQIRRLAHDSKDLENVVGDDVAAYITKNGLYQVDR